MSCHHVRADTVTFGNDLPFVLVAGPCVIESRDHAFFMAEKLLNLCNTFQIPFVFKSSYDKANRLSIKSERGVGIKDGLSILRNIKEQLGVPVLTDVHDIAQCQLAADYVDVLQTPALLCRQTDFLKAAALTGKPINVKKGQFLAPWDMANVAKKLESTGNKNIILCERGVSFGYNQLVSDFRALDIMAKTHYPVMFDATHSVQQPGGLGDATSGDRRFAPLLIRCALATGVASVFMEVHDDPKHAPSDAANMIPLSYLPYMLQHMKELDNMTKSYLSTLPTMESIYA